MSAELTSESRLPKWLIPVLIALSAASVTTWVFALPPVRIDVHSLLPALNAGLNSASALCLVIGYFLIRRGRVAAHRATMLFALSLSIVFLASYLIHHYQVGSVRYVGPDSLRSVYFLILIPHVILAATIVPLAGVTIFRGLADRRPEHKKIARITLPIWLYVSVTGVIVYLMLYR